MGFLPVVAGGLSMAGGMMSAFGSLSAGKDQKDAADFNADAALLAGKRKEEQIRGQFRRLEGQQRAGFGAANVAMSGSALDVLADQAMEAEKEALEARYGGESEAYTTRIAGENAQSASMFSAFSSFLGGAAGAANAAAPYFKK